MSFLSIVGLIALGLVGLAALYLLVWLALIGIEAFVLNHLKKIGLVRRDYYNGSWAVGHKVPKDYTGEELSDWSYRPSKHEVVNMIENALDEATASKKGKK